jgi:hypothetical protein
MTINIRRPIIDLDTRLRDIPQDWLTYIEPKILRGPYLPCWIWTAKTDKNGYPLIKNPYDSEKYLMAHRVVAKMFWDFPDSFYVTRTCPRNNCLNPGHLLVTEEHPRWLKAHAINHI